MVDLLLLAIVTCAVFGLAVAAANGWPWWLAFALCWLFAAVALAAVIVADEMVRAID